MFTSKVMPAIAAGTVVLCVVGHWLHSRLRDSPQERAWAQRLSEFWQKVQGARQAATPGWVKGARPSDECIAMHSDEDPHSNDVCTLDLAKMLQDRKDNGPDWPVPALFKPEEVKAGGVSCYWANWPGIDIRTGVILYMHGGAMITGHPEVGWCAHLSRATGKAVLTVDYRMAPEHPLPAATEDVVSVYRWLVEDQHVPPGKIALYGRSSGGMLVVLALQALVSQAVPLPACGIPVSPWAPHPTQPKHWDVVVGNTDANGQSTGKNYDVHDGKYNIFAGKFDGLPPLYVMVGGEEHVDRDLNVSIRLSKVAVEAGVRAELDIVTHMQHCPDNDFWLVPEATQAVARAAKFIDDAMQMHAGP